MRYVSEQFKEKQNRLIRPPLKMRFEVATDVNQRWLLNGNASLPIDGLDYSVAPVKNPSTCENEYYYAIVGDGKGVDDPNRMCAPVSSGGSFASPSHSVPFGVANVASANQEILIGNSSDYTRSFLGGSSPFVLSFKGGHIPDVIRIETKGYPTDTPWTTEGIILNPELSEEVYFSPSPLTTKRYRFFIKNTTTSGRFQFNWVRNDIKSHPSRNYSNIVFENDYISSVSIDEAGDLSSQSLPSFEMTVECLDPNGEYTPDSVYWGREIKGGQPCYFSAGYDVDGIVEYAPLFFGSLSKEPTYEDRKIVFTLSVPMALSEGLYIGNSYINGRTQVFQSKPNASLNVGNEVNSVKFSSFLGTLFDSSNDIFVNAADDNASLCNYYGSLPFADARQLTANALGGYIGVGFGRIDLFNSNNIQYKNFEDYITRYEQVKYTLESQPKVGKISIIRNKNTLSSDYSEVEANERISIISSSAVGYAEFVLPFWGYGKVTLVDAQSSVVGVTVTMVYTASSSPESIQADGSTKVRIGFRASAATTIKPIVRFYKVDTTKFDETESVVSSGTETYTNDNEFVNNTHNADKVKRVARFMSDVSNQYEVDVIQDLRYEIGDVIRLETQKNVFKTCVITALKFNLPGSTGHVTCRKIFAIEDSANAMSGIKNAELIKYTNGGGITVVESDRDTVVVGLVKYNNERYYIVAGASSIKRVQGGSTTIVVPNIKVTDNNAHVWNCYYFNANNTTVNFTPVDLGTYNTMTMNNIYAYGVVTLITKLYEEQNMTSPVDYDCSYVVN